MGLLFPLLFSLFISPTDSTDISTVKKLYKEGSFANAREALEKVRITEKNEDEVLYYNGLLAEDAENSISFYAEILKKHPKSAYTIDATYFISQYEFLKGSYEEVISKLNDITAQYPESKYFGASCYLIGSSYEALADTDNATIWYEKVTQIDTLMYSIAQEALTGLKKVRSIYSIQIGSFKNKEIAKELLTTYNKKGYQAWLATTVKDNVKFYKVLIGEFESREKANGFSKLFNEQENIPFWIIKIKKI